MNSQFCLVIGLVLGFIFLSLNVSEGNALVRTIELDGQVAHPDQNGRRRSSDGSKETTEVRTIELDGPVVHGGRNRRSNCENGDGSERRNPDFTNNRITSLATLCSCEFGCEQENQLNDGDYKGFVLWWRNTGKLYYLFDNMKRWKKFKKEKYPKRFVKLVKHERFIRRLKSSQVTELITICHLEKKRNAFKKFYRRLKYGYYGKFYFWLREENVRITEKVMEKLEAKKYPASFIIELRKNYGISRKAAELDWRTIRISSAGFLILKTLIQKQNSEISTLSFNKLKKELNSGNFAYFDNFVKENQIQFTKMEIQRCLKKLENKENHDTLKSVKYYLEDVHLDKESQTGSDRDSVEWKRIKITSSTFAEFRNVIMSKNKDMSESVITELNRQMISGNFGYFDQFMKENKIQLTTSETRQLLVKLHREMRAEAFDKVEYYFKEVHIGEKGNGNIRTTESLEWTKVKITSPEFRIFQSLIKGSSNSQVSKSLLRKLKKELTSGNFEYFDEFVKENKVQVTEIAVRHFFKRLENSKMSKENKGKIKYYFKEVYRYGTAETVQNGKMEMQNSMNDSGLSSMEINEIKKIFGLTKISKSHQRQLKRGRYAKFMQWLKKTDISLSEEQVKQLQANGFSESFISRTRDIVRVTKNGVSRPEWRNVKLSSSAFKVFKSVVKESNTELSTTSINILEKEMTRGNFEYFDKFVKENKIELTKIQIRQCLEKLKRKVNKETLRKIQYYFEEVYITPAKSSQTSSKKFSGPKIKDVAEIFGLITIKESYREDLKRGSYTNFINWLTKEVTITESHVTQLERIGISESFLNQLQKTISESKETKIKWQNIKISLSAFNDFKRLIQTSATTKVSKSSIKELRTQMKSGNFKAFDVFLKNNKIQVTKTALKECLSKLKNKVSKNTLNKVKYYFEEVYQSRTEETSTSLSTEQINEVSKIFGVKRIKQSYRSQLKRGRYSNFVKWLKKEVSITQTHVTQLEKKKISESFVNEMQKIVNEGPNWKNINISSSSYELFKSLIQESTSSTTNYGVIDSFMTKLKRAMMSGSFVSFDKLVRKKSIQITEMGIQKCLTSLKSIVDGETLEKVKYYFEEVYPSEIRRLSSTQIKQISEIFDLKSVTESQRSELEQGSYTNFVKYLTKNVTISDSHVMQLEEKKVSKSFILKIKQTKRKIMESKMDWENIKIPPSSFQSFKSLIQESSTEASQITESSFVELNRQMTEGNFAAFDKLLSKNRVQLTETSVQQCLKILKNSVRSEILERVEYYFQEVHTSKAERHSNALSSAQIDEVSKVFRYLPVGELHKQELKSGRYINFVNWLKEEESHISEVYVKKLETRGISENFVREIRNIVREKKEMEMEWKTIKISKSTLESFRSLVEKSSTSKTVSSTSIANLNREMTIGNFEYFNDFVKQNNLQISERNVEECLTSLQRTESEEVLRRVKYYFKEVYSSSREENSRSTILSSTSIEKISQIFRLATVSEAHRSELMQGSYTNFVSWLNKEVTITDSHVKQLDGMRISKSFVNQIQKAVSSNKKAKMNWRNIKIPSSAFVSLKTMIEESTSTTTTSKLTTSSMNKLKQEMTRGNFAYFDLFIKEKKVSITESDAQSCLTTLKSKLNEEILKRVKYYFEEVHIYQEQQLSFAQIDEVKRIFELTSISESYRSQLKRGCYTKFVNWLTKELIITESQVNQCNERRITKHFVDHIQTYVSEINWKTIDTSATAFESFKKLTSTATTSTTVSESSLNMLRSSMISGDFASFDNFLSERKIYLSETRSQQCQSTLETIVEMSTLKKIKYYFEEVYTYRGEGLSRTQIEELTNVFGLAYIKESYRSQLRQGSYTKCIRWLKRVVSITKEHVTQLASKRVSPSFVTLIQKVITELIREADLRSCNSAGCTSSKCDGYSAVDSTTSFFKYITIKDVVGSGYYGNSITGVPLRDNYNFFGAFLAASYQTDTVKSKDLHLLEDRIIVFQAYEASFQLNLALAFDTMENVVWSTNIGRSLAERRWKEYSLRIPEGTRRIYWMAESHGFNRGGAGFRNVRFYNVDDWKAVSTGSLSNKPISVCPEAS